MLLEPFCKTSYRLSRVFFLTPIFTTFVSVDDPTLVGDRIFVLGHHEQVSYGLTSFKVYLYTIFLASVFSGHKVTMNNFTLIGREEQNLTRAIKEALFIRVNDPSLNRNIGKYHLPHIWDEVLLQNISIKTKELTQWLFHLPSTPMVSNSISLQAITSAKTTLQMVAITSSTRQ